MLEARLGFNSELFGIARTLLRAAEEQPKPNGERLREFRDSNLESLKRQPVLRRADLRRLRDRQAGRFADVPGRASWATTTPLVQKVLAGKSPRERAAELVKGTKLKDVDLRKKLYEGGKKAVEAAKDPMIELARLVDPDARDGAQDHGDQVEEVKRQAYAQIAKAKFALEGTNTYPDATFTLRLAFGVVKGYEEDGKQVPFETTFAGLYERAKEHNDKPPFDLPQRWIERKDKLT